MNNKYLLGFILFCLMTTFPLYSSPASLQFLRVAPDARNASLATSAIAATEGISSLFWNPAGLAGLSSPEAMISYLSYVEGSSYYHGAYGVKAGKGGFAASATLLSFGESMIYESLSSDGTVTRNMAYSVSAGYGFSLLKNLALGGSVKYASEKVDDVNVVGVMFDLGAKLSLMNTRLHLGILAQNLGYALDGSPLSLKVGAATTLTSGEWNFTPMIETDLRNDTKNSVNLGGEFTYQERFSIRGGYNLDIGGSDIGGMEGLSLGLGMKVSRFSVDAAWIPMGFLGQTVVCTVMMKM